MSVSFKLIGAGVGSQGKIFTPFHEVAYVYVHLSSHYVRRDYQMN